MSAHLLSGWRREQREAFARLALLLTAPRVEAAVRADVEALFRATGPFPAVRAHREILPLLRHRLAELGIPSESAFSQRGDREQPTALLAAEHFRRIAVLEETLAAFGAAGLPVPMLLKGAAVAAHYPSPALRPMCDLDLAMPGEAAGDTAQALTRAGWTRGEAGGGAWRHRSGTLLDLHVPAGPAGSRILARAGAGPMPGASVPAVGDHLVLLAEHVLRSQGETVWKHLADARMLLHGHAIGEREALSLVAPEDRDLVSDFLAVLAAFRENATPVTIRSRFLHAMALDQSPREALHLARRVHMRLEPHEDAPAAGIATAREGAAGLAALTARERAGLAMKLAAGYALRGEVRRIVALAKSQRRFAISNPLFRSAP